jgi:sterol desaturase/sphingolipid hydroxylase (fatty acid hydroxylase superfamily)
MSDLLFQQMKGFHSIITISVLAVMLLWETFSPYFGFFRDRSAGRLIHGGKNLLLGSINMLVGVAIVTGVILTLASYVEVHQIGLFYWIGVDGWIKAILAVLVLDIWTYWWHRFNHRIPFFWRFHQVHHSDPNMDVTTAFRFHFGELFLSHILRFPLIPLFGIQLWHVVLFELLMFSNVQFHHANIGIGSKFDRFYRIFFTSPEMHKVHHSVERAEFDSNFTALLSVWDRLFGTYQISADPHKIQFGLKGCDDPSKQTIPSLLKAPIGDSRFGSNRDKY